MLIDVFAYKNSTGTQQPLYYVRSSAWAASCVSQQDKLNNKVTDTFLETNQNKYLGFQNQSECLSTTEAATEAWEAPNVVSTGYYL